MKALSTSEEQVMAALWACGKPATRRQIAAKLPPDCVWADSTLLNFLLRLEAKGYVRPEKQGNKNIYTPLVRRVTYCGAVSAAHLQTLYDGDLRSMVAALSDTGRITNAEMERLALYEGAQLCCADCPAGGDGCRNAGNSGSRCLCA